MSNIFITDIVGSSTYAVPTDDTELAAATSGLDTLISGVSNLTYDRVLAWVEDSGGPGGAEGTRTLNCLIEKFTYNTDECPSESEVDTLTAAIESALEADANITSVGNQQVHIFQAGAYFLWNRDSAGGFLYPNVTTDDVVVGGHVSPAGKWFDDGDLVLGASAMSGTEKLRVVGDARVEGKLTVTGTIDPTDLVLDEQSDHPTAPAAGKGILWVRDDAPNVLVFTDDAGTDWDLNTGGTSLWQDGGGYIYPNPSTDDVTIGATAMSGTEKLYVYNSDSSSFIGILSVTDLGSNSISTMQSYVAGWDSGFGGGSLSSYWAAFEVLQDTGFASGAGNTAYGLKINQMGSSGSVGTAYGVYISTQNATTGWGVYQAGGSDENYFNGATGFGTDSLATDVQVEIEPDTVTSAFTGLLVDINNTSSDITGARGIYVDADNSSADSSANQSFVSFDADYSQTGPLAQTNSITGFRSKIDATAGTIDKSFHYIVSPGDTGGGTITTSYGFYCEDLDVAGTIGTAYGVYIEDQTATTANYGIYQAGSDDLNYFAAITGFGAVPTGAAYVQLEDTRDTPTIITYYGFSSDYTKTGTNASASYYGYNTSVKIDTGNGTLTTWRGLYVGSPSGTSGGSTITNVHGVYVEDMQTGPAASATTYGFYQAGSSDLNYFAGTVGLNNASPTSGRLLHGTDTDETAATVGVEIELDKNATSTKTSWTGFSVSQDVVASGTVTDSYGIRIESPTGSGTLTDSFGVWIGDMDLSSTRSFGIYQSSDNDRNYFAGNVLINSVNDTFQSEKLHVREDRLTGTGSFKTQENLAEITGSNTGYNLTQYQAKINYSSTSSGGLGTLYGFQAQYLGSVTGTPCVVGTYAMFEGEFIYNSGDDVITNLYGLWIREGAGSSSSGVVTTGYGVRIQDIGRSGSTIYGVYIDDQTGSTTYGIYQDGADDVNYFRGQVGVGTNSPATSAAIEILSTNLALLVSRMTTTQRNALTAVNGMIIYNTTTNQMEGYIGGAWTAM